MFFVEYVAEDFTKSEVLRILHSSQFGLFFAAFLMLFEVVHKIAVFIAKAFEPLIGKAADTYDRS